MTEATVVRIEPEGTPEPRSAPEGAVVAYQPQREAQTALYELGGMSDQEFESRIATLKAGVARIETLQRSLLTETVDWGNVPGVPKAFLFKPGAEKLGLFYHLVPEFTTTREVTEQSTGIDRIDYTTTCLLHHQSHEGPVVGAGIGVASSWEARYRWRNTERICPVCGKPAVIKGNAEYGGGWLCWKKRDGCGAKWTDGTAAIEGQQVGRSENEEPHDLGNTLAKMSEKRAHVDAVIRATGSSGIFTQDEDKVAPDTAAPPVPSGAAQRSSEAAPRSGANGVTTTAPAPGHTSLTGEISKVADGIRRETDGNATYDVTFKAGGKTYHAIATGTMAERLVREVKPSVGDPITVEGRYHERGWTDKNGKAMPAVKELLDISRIVVRDEVTLPLDVPSPAATSPSGTATTVDAPTSASTNGNDVDLTDEAHIAFGDMAIKFGEEGYVIDHEKSIIESAERLLRPKSGTYVVHGWLMDHDKRVRCEFITDHDFAPPPKPGEVVTMTGTFVRAPQDGRLILLGQMS